MPLADSISCQVIGCLAVILDQQITVGQDSEAVPRRADGIRNVDREFQFAITNTSFVNLLKLTFSPRPKCKSLRDRGGTETRQFLNKLCKS